ncbi:MAG: hypothetical protein NTU74_18375 [Deltaproteobacteria bacterium]|nr:hypothetical protein [Deltaproteobacteria bacterium]
MKKNGFLLIAACFISGLIVASANAQMGGGKGKDMGMWGGTHVMHIINKLGLDDNQSKEVKAVVFKLQKEMIQKREICSRIGSARLLRLLANPI